MKDVHTESVQSTISQYNNNKVLDNAPPPINIEEQNLTRKSRCLLSQLRSGYSRKLNSYMSRIDDTVQDICPECGDSPHNTNHLFSLCRWPHQEPLTIDVSLLQVIPSSSRNSAFCCNQILIEIIGISIFLLYLVLLYLLVVVHYLVLCCCCTD